MKEIIIRKETEKDYEQTELVAMRAFWNRHGAGCSEHYFVHLLRKADCYLPELSRVAEMDGKIVGAILYSKAEIWVGEEKKEVITFGPLCVEPTAQSLGIGGKLLKQTIQLAKEAGYPGICIFGEPDYYPKHGFITCDHFHITSWEGKNFNAFMGYELQEGAFLQMQGRFREPDVFEKCNNEDELAEFNKNFPGYSKLTLSCGWLHKQSLGRICEVQKNVFKIKYWEQELPARLSEAFFKNDLEVPVTGDYVTFDLNPYGEARIVSVCERNQCFIRKSQSTCN